MPDKAENDAGYKNAQRQRALERKVREAKRDQAMAEASNDTVAAEDAASKAKKAESELKAFTKETGLTLRRDRLQVQSIGSIESAVGDIATKAQSTISTTAESVGKTAKYIVDQPPIPSKYKEFYEHGIRLKEDYPDYKYQAAIGLLS